MIAGAKLPRSQRYLIYTLFFALPWVVLSRVAVEHIFPNNYASALPFTRIMAYALPVISIIWVTLICVYRRSPGLYLFLLTISFLVMGIPMLAIYPLITLELGDYNTFAEVVCFILAGSGAALFFLALLFQCLPQRCKCKCGRPKCQIGKYFSLTHDFRNLGFWANSSSVIVAASVLSYMWSNYYLLDKPLQFAFLVSMPLTLLLIFFSHNYVLGLPIHKPPGHEDTTVLDFLFGDAFDDLSDFDKEQIAKQTKKESRCQAALSAFGIFLPPAVAVPVFFFALDGQEDAYRYSVFTSMAAIMAWAVLSMGLLEIKKRCGPYARSGLGALIAGEWLLVLLPFCVGLPSAVVAASGDSDQFERVISSAIGYMIGMLVALATLLSLVLNHVFRRLEYEKRARHCVGELRHELREKAVRADNKVLRVMFDNFQLFGKETLLERLKKRMLAYYWDVAEKDPDPRFSKILVPRKTFQELERRSRK